MRQTQKMALASMVAALSLVLMLMTGILPFMTYALPGIAGMLLTVVVLETSKRWAFACYVAITFLSFLIAPDKEAAVVYAFFLGYYPILKSAIEKIGNLFLEWLIKLPLFNVSMVAAYALVLRVMTTGEDFYFWGKYTLYILLAMGNVAFVLYDRALTKLITLYLRKLRSQFLKKIFHQ